MFLLPQTADKHVNNTGINKQTIKHIQTM